MTALSFVQQSYRRAVFLVCVATLFAYGVVGAQHLLTPWLAWTWLAHAIYFSLPLHKATVFAGGANPESFYFMLVHGWSFGSAWLGALIFFLVEFYLDNDFNAKFYNLNELTPVAIAFLQLHGYFVPLLAHLIDLALGVTHHRLHHNKASWVGSVGVLALRILWFFASPLLAALGIELLSPNTFALAAVYGFVDANKMTVVLSLAATSLAATIVFVAVVIRPGRRRDRSNGNARPSERDALLGGAAAAFLDSDEEAAPVADGKPKRTRSRLYGDDDGASPMSSTKAIARASTPPPPAATAAASAAAVSAARLSRAQLPAPVFPPAGAADVPRLLAHEPTNVALSMAKLSNDQTLIDDMSALLLSEDRRSFVVWVSALLSHETRVGSAATLLRGDSSRAGRAVQEFVRLSRPADFTKPIVQAIRHFAAEHRFPSVAPAEVGSAEVQRLKELFDAVLGGIVAALKKMPRELLDLGHELETAALAQFNAQVASQAVGTLAMQHIFGPVVAAPESFGLEASAVAASNRANASAALQLVAHALLLLARGDDETIKNDPVLRRLKSTFADSKNSLALVLQTVAAGAPSVLHSEPPLRVPLDRLAGAMETTFRFINANGAALGGRP